MKLKFLILIFLSLFTLTLLSACGKSDSGGSDSTDETDVPVDETDHTVEHNNDPMFN